MDVVSHTAIGQCQSVTVERNRRQFVPKMTLAGPDCRAGLLDPEEVPGPALGLMYKKYVCIKKRHMHVSTFTFGYTKMFCQCGNVQCFMLSHKLAYIYFCTC